MGVLYFEPLFLGPSASHDYALFQKRDSYLVLLRQRYSR